jgi:UDP-3-O-[3-hydroxymyristoyl] glucosamine N-acyltransferase
MMNQQSLPLRWRLRGEWSISEIMAQFESDYFVEGSSVRISGVASINNADPDDLAFCSAEGQSAINLIAHSNAGIILCKKSLMGLIDPKPNSMLVFLNNPRLIFVQFTNRARIIHEQFPKDTVISPTAKIHKSARLGSRCIVGDFVTIGPDCSLGDNVIIGDRTSLQNCDIGPDVIVQPGAALGADGFAYERRKDGTLERFPHFGRVIIGKSVEISTNCSIARGSLGNTVIGDGTKLDALVHVAHNTVIGKSCQLTAGTIIGGSSIIGDSCWTGLNCTIKDHVRVGNNVLVASGASVVKDVADGDVVAGVPAKSIKDKVSTKDLFIMVGKHPV